MDKSQMAARCRRMTAADIQAVVQTHQQAFPGFFLTRMGPRMLGLYYETILDYEQSIALVADNSREDSILGFAVGFRNPEAFYTLFRRRRRKLLAPMIKALMSSPDLIGEIWRNARRVSTKFEQPESVVELSSLASIAEEQGLGTMLLHSFNQEAQRMNTTKIVLTTDAKGNDRVRRFYEKRGFKLDGYEERGARRLCHYSRSQGNGP
jgi:ribosomal protein S18 acetylase RimI-like enzyme